MEDNFNIEQREEQQPNPVQKEKLPNALASMILGIISLVVGCSPIVGIIIGAIGLSKAKKAYAINEQYPDHYTGQGFAKTGKITSLIGLILGILSTIFWVVYILGVVWLVEEGIYDMY